MTNLLSQNIVVGAFCFWFNDSRILLSHIAYVAQLATAIYFASAIESATIGCFFEDQDIAPDLR